MLNRSLPDDTGEPSKGQLQVIVGAVRQGIPVDEERVPLVEDGGRGRERRPRVVHRVGRSRARRKIAGAPEAVTRRCPLVALVEQEIRRVVTGKVSARPPNESRMDAGEAQIGKRHADSTADGHQPYTVVALARSELEAEVSVETRGERTREEYLEPLIDVAPALRYETVRLVDATRYVRHDPRVLHRRARNELVSTIDGRLPYDDPRSSLAYLVLLEPVPKGFRWDPIGRARRHAKLYSLPHTEGTGRQQNVSVVSGDGSVLVQSNETVGRVNDVINGCRETETAAALEELQRILESRELGGVGNEALASYDFEMRLREGVVVSPARAAHRYEVDGSLALDDLLQGVDVLGGASRTRARNAVVSRASGRESRQAEQSVDLADDHPRAGFVEIPRQVETLKRAAAADEDAPLAARPLERRCVQQPDQPLDQYQRQLDHAPEHAYPRGYPQHRRPDYVDQALVRSSRQSQQNIHVPGEQSRWNRETSGDARLAETFLPSRLEGSSRRRLVRSMLLSADRVDPRFCVFRGIFHRVVRTVLEARPGR